MNSIILELGATGEFSKFECFALKWQPTSSCFLGSQSEKTTASYVKGIQLASWPVDKILNQNVALAHKSSSSAILDCNFRDSQLQ